MSNSKRRVNWSWLEIVDIEIAQRAAKYGYWAAVWVGVFSTVVATVALATSTDTNFLDGGAYVDAVLFFFVAGRIKKYSRAFIVIGTLLWVLEKIIFIHVLTVFDWVQTVFVLFFFIHGLRGVFAYHRFLRLSSWQAVECFVMNSLANGER